MCTEIQIRGGPRLERMGDLWREVGRPNVVMTHEAEFSEDDCLCHVDVEATAFLSGYTSIFGWDEAAADFVWVPRSHQQQDQGSN